MRTKVSGFVPRLIAGPPFASTPRGRPHRIGKGILSVFPSIFLFPFGRSTRRTVLGWYWQGANLILPEKCANAKTAVERGTAALSEKRRQKGRSRFKAQSRIRAVFIRNPEFGIWFGMEETIKKPSKEHKAQSLIDRRHSNFPKNGPIFAVTDRLH